MQHLHQITHGHQATSQHFATATPLRSGTATPLRFGTQAPLRSAVLHGVDVGEEIGEPLDSSAGNGAS